MKTKRSPTLQLRSIMVVVVIVAMIVAAVIIKRQSQPSENTHVVGRPKELPSLIPADFPVYQDATVIRMETNPPDEFLAVLATPDPRGRVYDKLLTNTKTAGWKTEEIKEWAFRATKEGTAITLAVTQNPSEQTAILVQITNSL